MKNDQKQVCDCDATAVPSCCGSRPMEMLPLYGEPEQGRSAEACCGPPAGPASNRYERPGYKLCSFVQNFIDTPAGPVVQVKTKLNLQDVAGGLSVRLGIGRMNYTVAPGLYALGHPDSQSPVLVSANYKLSFDHLRSQLEGLAAWILVLDTRGINVWCAAGKGTFAAAEIIRQVQHNSLAKIVQHRRLILPQLAASGVAAQDVKKGCGFEVVWGPIRVKDLAAFLAAGLTADEAMRRITFAFNERLVLVPVELSILRKYLIWTLVTMFVLSGLGPGFFSFSAAWHRGLLACSECLAGILAGCVLVPLLLPWIPGRAFSLKGAVTGAAAGLFTAAALAGNPYVGFMSGAALVLLATALSSFLAMNFTGSTPFTSPSGVEKEMRRAIPLQAAAILVAVGMWIGAAMAG